MKHSVIKPILAALLAVCTSIAQAGSCAPGMLPSNPDAAYADHGDGTVTHVPTGLVWKRCSEGQTWTGSTCTGTASTVTWAQALRLASDSQFAGKVDWRLANIKEMLSLVEVCRTSPTINETIFPSTPAAPAMAFWTGSPNADNSITSWAVNFYYGYAPPNHSRANTLNVRLVRGGQSFDNLGIGANAPTVKFLSETLPDGTYLVGSATKTWSFKNGGVGISGMKAVLVDGKTDSGAGITVTQLGLGDIAANQEFTVALPIAPVHTGPPVKTSYWKLATGANEDVSMTNSASGQFWLNIRTNWAPVFSRMQLDSVAAGVGQVASLPVLVEDADGDSLSVTASTGVVSGGVWSGVFSTPGIHPVTLTVSDGIESSSKTISVVVRDEVGVAHSFTDVATDNVALGCSPPALLASGIVDLARPGGAGLARDYADIEYLYLRGVVIGTSDGAARKFEPCRYATQAEALKMLMEAARASTGLVFDEPPRALDNLLVEDASNGVFINASWAAPYVLKAETLGIVPAAEYFSPQAPATRAWLARVVTRLQALSVPLDAIGSSAATFGFPDQTDFATAPDYADALAAAFFGYMGQLSSPFSPNAAMVRADVARVASRLLRAPRADDLVMLGTSPASVAGRILPGVAQGTALRVAGLVNLSAHRILQTGDTVKEEWIDPPEKHVNATIIKVGQGIVPNGAGLLVQRLPLAPVVVDTATPPSPVSEIRNLVVLLEDLDSGVRAVLRKDYAVLFLDRDGDGVRDDLDLWPGNALFSSDANGNGIPDNAESNLGLVGKRGSDPIVVDGATTTLIQALVQGKFEGIRIALGGTPTVPLTPRISRIVADDSSVSIAIQAEPTDGSPPIRSYQSSCRSNGKPTRTGSSANPPVTVLGLATGATYSCSVTASNDYGTSAESAPLDVVSSLNALPPATPVMVDAVAGVNSAVIAFNGSDNSGSVVNTGYRASCTADGQSPAGHGGTASPITVYGLTAGAVYSCTVLASNNYGSSAPSAPATVTPFETLPSITSYLSIDTMNREAVRLFYLKLFPQSANVPMNWSGNYATGDAGTTGQAYQDAVALRINWYRAMAGVPANVTLDAAYAAKDQKAALMFSVNNQWSHYPPSTWIYYTADGAEAAARSNVWLGVEGEDAVAAYMTDYGSNNAAAAHRRWLLFPQTSSMATGSVPGGLFNGNYVLPANALTPVMDAGSYSAPRPATRDDFVAWPPKGFVPYPIVPGRWSMSFPAGDFSNARVSVKKEGVDVGVTTEPITVGAGENTIVWLLQGSNDSSVWARPSRDEHYSVVVSNVLLNGSARSFSYEVTLFDPEVATPGAAPVTTSVSASPMVSEPFVANASPMASATSYQFSLARLMPLASVMPTATVPGLWTSTIGSYSLMEGSAFHLQHGEADFGPQTLTLEKALSLGDNASLSFQRWFGPLTTETEQASVQVSLDGGVFWRDIDVESGRLDGTSASTKTISLSQFAGKVAHVRFLLTATGYVNYAASSGWYFNGIRFDHVSEIQDNPLELVESAVPRASFTVGSAGSYVLSARAKYQGRYFSDWGPNTVFQVDGSSGPVPVLTLPITELIFPGQSIGTESSSRTLSLFNSGTAPLLLSGISILGDFSATDNCGASVPPGAGCELAVKSAPSALGVRPGAVRFVDAANVVVATVDLRGTGLAVAKSTQRISFSAVGSVHVGETSTLTGAATSGLGVVFSSLTPAVCSVAGNAVLGLATGSCTIVAEQPGNSLYDPAAPVSQTAQVAYPVLAPISLEKGWNLLGNSWSQPLSVATLFGDPALVATVWKWDVAAGGWQFYTPSMDPVALDSYVRGRGFGPLSVINPGDGYWVNAKIASSLQNQAGVAAALSADKLVKGWNLVATGMDVTPAQFNLSLNGKPTTTGGSPVNFTSLWAWDNLLGQWYFYAPLLDSNGELASYITGRTFLDFNQHNKMLGKGTGFWVNMP